MVISRKPPTMPIARSLNIPTNKEVEDESKIENFGAKYCSSESRK